jgi:hypothetical protein
MKPDNEFQQIGKEIPYKTPPGFFESVCEETLQKAILSKQNHRRNNNRRMIFSVAASTAILWFLGYQWMIYPQNKPGSNLLSQETQSAGQTIIQKKAVSADQIAAKEIIKTFSSRPTARIVSESLQTDGLNDVLSEMTDEELQQMVAMYKTDPFHEETVQ